MIRTRIILFSLSSAWMIGIGFRFLMMDIGNEFYYNSTFDKVFDWGILFLLGIILAVFMVYDMQRHGIHYEDKEGNNESNVH